jgi:hypothetical protein
MMTPETFTHILNSISEFIANYLEFGDISIDEMSDADLGDAFKRFINNTSDNDDATYWVSEKIADFTRAIRQLDRAYQG